MTEHDVAVVGAGPAGLAAAVTAAEVGLSVVLVDGANQAGGQFWRHPDDDTLRTDEGHGQHQWRRFVRLRSRLRELEASDRSVGRIDRVAGHQVWFVEPCGDAAYTLHLSPSHATVGAPAPERVRAGALVLCPGGYDRQLPVPGWDLPGVMAAGGVQALLKAHRTMAGHRAVVAGTGPFLLSVAQGLTDAGATVVAVCEANSVTGWARSPMGSVAVPSKAFEAAGYVRALARHRTPFRTRTVVTGVHGDDRVRSVSLGRLDRRGRLRGDTSVPDLEVDLVALGWGFTPALELVTAVGAATRVDVDESLVAEVDRWQRTSVPGVYVAGEATGVGGALLALAEGELAGLAVSCDRGRDVASRRVRRLQWRIARGRAFAAAMHRTHPVPSGWEEWLEPHTTLCRCEEVTVQDVRTAHDLLGAADARTAKLMARPGMGWCQGRVCGFATAKLARGPRGPLTVSDLTPVAKRPLAAPVSLARLAADDAERQSGGPDPPHHMAEDPGTVCRDQ